MNATTTNRHQAQQALAAWDHGKRRRNTAGVVDSVADGVLALGGTIAVNAFTSLNFGGLPAGRAGLSLGLSMVCAGLAAITARRSRRPVPQQPSTAPLPRVQPSLATARSFRDVA